VPFRLPRTGLDFVAAQWDGIDDAEMWVRRRLIGEKSDAGLPARTQ